MVERWSCGWVLCKVLCCLYEDDWNRLEWSNGGRVGGCCASIVCVCIKMIGMG